MPTEEQTYREGVKKDLKDIKELVTFTNGKVKKIIIALIALTFFVLGQIVTTPEQFVGLITHLL